MSKLNTKKAWFDLPEGHPERIKSASKALSPAQIKAAHATNKRIQAEKSIARLDAAEKSRTRYWQDLSIYNQRNRP